MALRAAGCPGQEIAERIGHSRASIYRWLVRYGIPRRAVTLRRGARRTHGDRGLWLATSDLLALWEDRKPDIEYIAQYSGARPSAIRERLISAGVLPLAMIVSGEVPVNDLITVRLPLERVHDALDTVAKGAAIKVTIEP